MNSMRTIESYKGYEIEAIVVRLTDDIFTAYGYVRSTKMIRIGLPFEKSFKTGGTVFDRGYGSQSRNKVCQGHY